MIRATLKSSVSFRNIHLTAPILMSKKRSKVVGESAAAEVGKPEPLVPGKSGIEIRIFAKPGAQCNSVTDISDVVSVQIAAPPVDGEANSELVKYLAKVLDLKKSQVTLEKGSKSRNKTVIVSGSNIEEILEKLQEEKTKS